MPACIPARGCRLQPSWRRAGLTSPPHHPLARRALEAYAAEGAAASATCTGGRLISAIVNPLYGDAAQLNCNSTSSYRVVAEACLGRTGCTVNATNAVFNPDRVGALPAAAPPAARLGCARVGAAQPGLLPGPRSCLPLAAPAPLHPSPPTHPALCPPLQCVGAPKYLRFSFECAAAGFATEALPGDGSCWLLVLSYLHQGGTNPPLSVLYGNFPSADARTLGADGTTAPASWGHMPPSALASMKFKLRWAGGRSRPLQCAGQLAAAAARAQQGPAGGSSRRLGWACRPPVPHAAGSGRRACAPLPWASTPTPTAAKSISRELASAGSRQQQAAAVAEAAGAAPEAAPAALSQSAVHTLPPLATAGPPPSHSSTT